ncbi:MAG: hypothetical protein OEW59_01515 [Gammaproteobacteria bacterium]|nr:hypothetical protein [Gammaproteobacteria bacterium]
MKPGEVLHELAFPLTNQVLLISIGTFGGALWLSLVLIELGPFFLILGLLGLMLVSGALFRYGVKVLERRAQGLGTPVADIDTVTFLSDVWTFFPMVQTVAALWVADYLNDSGNPSAGVAILVVFALVLPASLAVLAITHSPLQSVNPRALYVLVRRCGSSYLWIPLGAATLFTVIAGVGLAGLPFPGVVVLQTYAVFAAVNLTGAVMHASGVIGEVSIDVPLEKSEAEAADEIADARHRALDHAYGFISRGNRDGGFNHIRDHIAAEEDASAAVAWFFNEMMRWEKKDAALFFGQDCFAHFLHHDNDAMALKIALRCIHEDPSWRPRSEDRGHAIELAGKYGRDDLLTALRR